MTRCGTAVPWPRRRSRSPRRGWQTIMLRMPSSQPPIEASTMVSAGSTACCTRRGQRTARSSRWSAPGRSRRVGGRPGMSWVSRYSSISASQKYGMAARNVVDGTSESSQVPRRQPTTAPSPMPSSKLMTVAVPTRSSVHSAAECSRGHRHGEVVDRQAERAEWASEVRYCPVLDEDVAAGQARAAGPAPRFARRDGAVCCLAGQDHLDRVPRDEPWQEKVEVTAIQAATR